MTLLHSTTTLTPAEEVRLLKIELADAKRRREKVDDLDIYREPSNSDYLGIRCLGFIKLSNYTKEERFAHRLRIGEANEEIRKLWHRLHQA